MSEPEMDPEFVRLVRNAELARVALERLPRTVEGGPSEWKAEADLKSARRALHREWRAAFAAGVRVGRDIERITESGDSVPSEDHYWRQYLAMKGAPNV